MPTYEFTTPDGKNTWAVDAPAGGTKEQAYSILQDQIASGTAPAPAEPSLAMSAGRALNDVPRQLGLTARYGLEGIANTAQIATEPIRRLITDPLLPDRQRNLSDLVTNKPAPPKSLPLGQQVSQWLDSAGFPTPQTPTERVIGDASRLVAGAAVPAAAATKTAQALATPTEALIARTAPEALSASQATLRSMGTNLPGQFGGAAGAGLAGGASREAGGSPLEQAGASLIGGVVGNFAPGAAGAVVDAVKSRVQPLIARMTPQDIEVKLSTMLQGSGINYADLSAGAKASLREEVGQMMKQGKDLDPAAVSRLAAFRAVPGAVPTRGMISQNPVDITREQNLAKIGANSSDTTLQGLPLVQNQNNRALIGNLNNLGANGTQPIEAGRALTGNIRGTDAAMNSIEQGAWDFAKGTPGYRAPISNAPLHAGIAAASDEALLGFLPKQTTDYMAAFQTGAQPFTPQQYKNLRSMLSNSLQAGGNEAAAARSVIRGLDSVPMQPIKNPGGIDFGQAPVTAGVAGAMRAADAQAPDAIAAVDRARRATAAKYGYQESSPLVATTLAGGRAADPERIAQSYIINGTLGDAQMAAREMGDGGREVIRQALAEHIKKQALGGASDEVGKVSQKALSDVLGKNSDEKLRLFFSPEEIAGLRNTGRVASLMQVQPVGSAVNNSNSGALLLGKGLDLLDKTPFLGPMVGPALRNIDVSMRTRAAQNYAPGLLRQADGGLLGQPPLLLPGMALGGLLAGPPTK